MNENSRIEEINTELNKTMESLQNIRIIQKKIVSVSESLGYLKNQREELYLKLDKEEKDVERLNNFTFENLFHTLTSSKTDKLQKEEEEVLEVKSRIDRLNFEIQAEERQLKNLKSDKSIKLQLKERYSQLINEKREIIKNIYPGIWQELEKRNEEIDCLKLKLKEIKEAVYAGERASTQVCKIKKSLESAANWGTLDMVGGGILSSVAKRNKMRESQDQIHDFQHTLRKFSRELKDVDMEIIIDLGIDDFLGFADWFFDGLLVDWMVQSKINNAKDQINSLDEKIDSLINRLRMELKRSDNAIKELEETNRKEILAVEQE
jgi:chromosome segregation ATPase